MTPSGVRYSTGTSWSVPSSCRSWENMAPGDVLNSQRECLIRRDEVGHRVEPSCPLACFPSCVFCVVSAVQSITFVSVPSWAVGGVLGHACAIVIRHVSLRRTSRRACLPNGSGNVWSFLTPVRRSDTNNNVVLVFDLILEGWHWTTTSWSIPTVHSTRRPTRASTLQTFQNHSSLTCAERIARDADIYSCCRVES